jgi:class 3 adenylate cyclase
MTKGTDHMLFISESTCEMLSDRPADLVFVDEFEVRGRQAKMRIFTIRDQAGSSGLNATAAPDDMEVEVKQ